MLWFKQLNVLFVNINLYCILMPFVVNLLTIDIKTIAPYLRDYTIFQTTCRYVLTLLPEAD